MHNVVFWIIIKQFWLEFDGVMISINIDIRQV